MTRRELGRCYRLLREKLEISIPLTSPLDFIPRFSSALILSERTQQKAATILMLAREKGITVGKDPTGLAASALYIATVLEGERRTQREIATVAQVTEVTIRNRYKEMAQKLNIQLKI
jgi:transcription initiation factor TFIIB